MPAELRYEARRKTSWSTFPLEIRLMVIKRLLNQIITRLLDNEDVADRRRTEIRTGCMEKLVPSGTRGWGSAWGGGQVKPLLKITQVSSSFGQENCKALCTRELASLEEQVRLHQEACVVKREHTRRPGPKPPHDGDPRAEFIVAAMSFVVEVLRDQAVSSAAFTVTVVSCCYRL